MLLIFDETCIIIFIKDSNIINRSMLTKGSIMKEHWNSRFSEEGYAYGIEVNDFLKESTPLIPLNAKVLCIADGEGRNAIYLAQHGFHVVAVDFSEVGLTKLQKRAKELDLKITTILKDLTDFDFGVDKWDVIVSIFAHLPKDLRKKIYAKIPTSLKENGLLILEAYTADQLSYSTGGPKDIEMLLSTSLLEKELDLKVMTNKEVLRYIQEGKYHNGKSATVQYIGQKK